MITRHDIAFMVQEIISECHSRPKGAEMIDLIDKYADKFGKDNNEFGHSGDKTVSSYPEDNQQPPKERKVSLEDIAIELWSLFDTNNEIKWSEIHESLRHFYMIRAQAILILLNAKESTEKE